MISAAVAALPARKELAVKSKRVEEVKKNAEKVAELCRNEKNLEIVARFTAEIVALLRTAVEKPRYATCPNTQRRKMWVSYSKIRQEKLPSLWKKFLCDIEYTISDPLFTELVNDSLMEQVIHENFRYNIPQHRSTTSQVEISEDDENVIRDTCGYVGMKLHKEVLEAKE